jgi:hypothetical protein
MPRLARLPFIPFGWYYVGLQSVPDKRMVTSYADLLTALTLLRATLRRKGARLHAGYVDERETHLALQAGEVPVRAIIGGFQHEYSRVFNRTHGGRGSLFRLHHHVLLIQHERWLVPLVRFIHWKRHVEAPGDYPRDLWWSSDAVYRGRAKHDWLTTNVVLRMLSHGARSRQIQVEAYRRIFDLAPVSDHADLFRHGSEEDPRLLGDAQFITCISRLTGLRIRDRSRCAHHLEGDIPGVVSRVIESFNALCDERLSRRQAVAWRHLVTCENLRSRSRKRPLPMVRALCASYFMEHRIATPADAARFFGCGPRPVSAGRRRYYKAIFRKCFGAMPGSLFNLGRDGDGSIGRRNEGHEREFHLAGCSELEKPCDCS